MNIRFFGIYILIAVFSGFQTQKLKAPEGSLSKTLDFLNSLILPENASRLKPFLKSRKTGALKVWSDILIEDLSKKIWLDKFSSKGLKRVLELQSRCQCPERAELAAVIANSLRVSIGRLVLVESRFYSKFDLGDIGQEVIFNSNIAKFKDFIGLFGLLKADAFSSVPAEFAGSGEDYRQAWMNLMRFISKRIVKILNDLVAKGRSREAFAQIDGLAAALCSSFFSCQSVFGMSLLSTTSRFLSEFINQNLSLWDDVILRDKIESLSGFLRDLYVLPAAFVAQKPTCAICSCPVLTLALESLPCHHDGIVYHLACLEGLPRASADGQRHCPQCRGPISLGTILNLALRQFGRQSSELSVKSHNASPKRSRRASIVV